jgi:colicin import membrane protein
VIVDNRAMRSIRSITPKLARDAFIVALLTISLDALAQAPPTPDALRDQFPPSSIDSVKKADAALAATGGAKVKIDKDYKTAARACISTVLVNDCIDRAREARRKLMADVDAIELEANRFKRRERNDRIEADRTKREADRAGKAPSDAEQRERNRKDYDAKQAEAARSAEDRARSGANRKAKPAPKAPAPGSAEADAARREKNTIDYANKQKVAKEHQAEIERRMTQKAADRKRREEAKTAKDAKSAAAAAAAAEAAKSGLPSLTTPKP